MGKRDGAAVEMKMMPPWFADPRYGHFANDASLTEQQIATIVCLGRSGRARGRRARRSSAAQMDRRLEHSAARCSREDAARPVPIPAHGEVEYTYEIVPTHFTEDRWVQMSEIRPGSPAHVHHAVVYIRPPDSQWLRHAPVGEPFTASTLTDPRAARGARDYQRSVARLRAGQFARISGRTAWRNSFPPDRTWFSRCTTPPTARPIRIRPASAWYLPRRPPKQRVITLQLNNHALIIPPGADDFRVEVQGTLPNDATLLSLFPHMHLRGKRFEYDIVHDDGSVEVCCA